MAYLSKDIIKIESVNSTNDFAKELLSKSHFQHNMTVIIAREQTKGRGQIGNSWESEPGKNITASIILKPHNLDICNHFYLSIACSLGIVSFLKQTLPNVTIKWPNDIYVNNKKICGILIENTIMGSTIQSSIIGIGLNINQTIFSEWIPNPTSLALETNMQHSLDIVFTNLLDSCEWYFTLLLMNKLKNMYTEYLSNLYLINKDARFSDNRGSFEGEIVTVKDDGIMVIKNKLTNKINEYAFKEVQYL